MTNTALITGASSGIGRAMAEIHAKRGGNLVAVARRKNKLQELKKELEAIYQIQVDIILQDLTEVDGAKKTYDEVRRRNIEVDYLINNAGFGGHGRFHERPLEQDLSMIQLNISALTALSHYFIRDFVKRNSGRILNVSSTASLMPGPLQAVYFATKAYVTSFSYALSEELSDTGVTVTALLPGATASEFSSTANLDDTDLFNQTASAESVARAGYEAMLAGKRSVVAGLTLSQKVMMKFVPLTPMPTKLKMVRKMQEKKK